MTILRNSWMATWLYFSSTVLSAVVEPSGFSVKVDNVHYFVSPYPAGLAYNGSMQAMRPQAQLGFVPATVASEPGDDLESLFRNWTVEDDVWQPGFLDTVLLAGGNSTRKASYYPGQYSTVVSLYDGDNIPPGPYFLDISTGAVHPVYRLYDDFSGAFTQSLLQRPDGQFETLSAQVPSAASLTIGVPSRLYFTPTEEKPLAGVRIGVKDIYALAGVKRSNGNRAWYGLYPPENQTAPAIQNLIDAGAIIVGLQKLSQFANGEKATADWVDYHSPFNPRGDAYQDTSSSSAGAGSSMASYHWLDLAVGSDTGGSIRGPASNQGVFGHRPSHGLVSLDNVMPLSPSMDTAGLLARDPGLLDIANAATYHRNYTRYTAKHPPAYPKTLYTLGFPEDGTPKARILANFAHKLARFLNTNVTTLDMDTEWQRSGPSSVKGQTISQLLNITYTTLITKDQIRLVRDPFYEDYAAVHDDRLPFIDPASLSRWTWGASQPDSLLAEAHTNKTLFATWFNSKILPPSKKTCTSGFLLHTDSTGSFKAPRNHYLSPPALPFGFSNGEISVFAGVPDTVFPLGEIPVFSNITNHVEYLPVSVDVVAARGCDGLVARLAVDLVREGLLVQPKTGARIGGGEILL